MGNKSEYLAAYKNTLQQFQENPIIHWEAIVWIHRPTFLWVIEAFCAFIGLIEALLVAYLSYKVNWTQPTILMAIMKLTTIISSCLLVYTVVVVLLYETMTASAIVLLSLGAGQYGPLYFDGNLCYKLYIHGRLY